MRQRITHLFILLLVLLGLLAVTTCAQGGSTNQPAREALRLSKEKVEAETETPLKEISDNEEPAGTIFNGQHVPPMAELGKTYEDDISHGYWYVYSRKWIKHNLTYNTRIGL